MAELQQTRIVGVINGVEIHQRLSDGYWDVTAIAKAAGRLIQNYNQLGRDKEAYHALVSVDVGIPTSTLIHTIPRGGNGPQGTWAHELIATHVAAWASPEVNYHIHKLIHDRAREEAQRSGRSFADVLFSTIFYEGEKGKRPYKPFEHQRAFHSELLKLNWAAKKGLKKSDISVKIRIHNAGPVPNLYKHGWEDILTLDGYPEAKQRKIRTKAKSIACILKADKAGLALGVMYTCAVQSETMEEYFNKLEELAGHGKLFVEEDVETEVQKSYRAREEESLQLGLWDVGREQAAS